MRCGICNKDTFQGYRGELVTIYTIDVLNRHKKRDHPTEYRAAIEARRTKMETTKRAKVAEAQRVSDARLAASRPVVVRSRGEEDPETYPSSRLTRYQVRDWNYRSQTDVRFPNPAAYLLYEDTMAEIRGLEGDARGYLLAAWEMGTPVTLEHLDELDLAAKAGQEAQ